MKIKLLTKTTQQKGQKAALFCPFLFVLVFLVSKIELLYSFFTDAKSRAADAAACFGGEMAASGLDLEYDELSPMKVLSVVWGEILERFLVYFFILHCAYFIV